MKKRAKWFLAAAATVVLAGPANALNQWGNYHWSTNGAGLTLRIEKQLSPVWDPYFVSSVKDWEASEKLSLTGATNNLGVNPKRCNPIAGKALVCNDAYGQRGWLGIASIWADGDHITQATTKLNDSYFNLSAYNKAEWRTMVACQEIGHDFGLDHQDENFDNANLGTCMDYTSEPLRDDGAGNNLQPNQADYDTLTVMYSHDDTAGSGGDPGGGNCNPHSPKCNGQDAFTFREVGKAVPSDSALVSADWGRAIGYDRSGRPNEFELDLGNGRHRITHVFWVPGHRPLKSEMHD